MRPTNKPKNWEDAKRLVNENLSSRFLALDNLEAYTEGRQYDGLAHWLEGGDTPLLERAPHIVQPIVDEAIKDFRDLTLNEWPAITCQSEEADKSDTKAVNTPEAELIDEFIAEAVTSAKLISVAAAAFYRALSCGTVVTLASVQRGQLKATNVRAKWCEPEWSKTHPDELDAIEISYPYIEELMVKGERVAVVKLFRRRIDRDVDITFQPVEAKAGFVREQYNWVAEVKFEHGLGFVPAVWWAFGKDEAFVGSMDGQAIQRLLLDEVDALNRAHSQHNRAALYAGDPQWVETGVEQGHNPTGAAPEGGIWRGYHDEMGQLSEDPAIVAREGRAWIGAGAGHEEKRKKGPGEIWRYGNPDARVELKTLPGDALDGISRDQDRLARIISDGLSWVRPDPGEFSRQGLNFQNLSGESMRWLYRRMTIRCGQFREWFTDFWLTPLLGIFVRLVAANQDGVLLESKAAAPMAVAKFTVPIGGVPEFLGLSLRLTWTDFFADTQLDMERRSKRVRDDLKAGIITLETAVKVIASTYKIDDAKAYAKLLEAEQEKRVKQAQEVMGDKDDDAPPSGQNDPKKDDKDPKNES